MRNSYRFGLTLSVLIMLLFAQALTAEKIYANVTSLTKSQLLENFSKAPVYFEPNQGQFEKEFKFAAHCGFASLHLTKSKILIEPLESKGNLKAISFGLTNACDNVSPKGVDKLNTKVSYLTGNHKRQWLKTVPTFGKVCYENILAGVDMLFHGTKGHLEFDFVLSPGVDPGDLILDFSGMDKLILAESGDLLIHANNRIIKLKAPVSYQIAGKGKKAVTSTYRLLSQNKVGFVLGAYDTDKPLIIDPVLAYSTYWNRDQDNMAGKIKIRPDGTPVVYAPYSNTPGNDGNSCLYILGPNGAIKSKIHIPDQAGAPASNAHGITSLVFDKDSNFYVAGETSFDRFPGVRLGGGQVGLNDNVDVYVAKISSDGATVKYCVHFGGIKDEQLGNIALMEEGYAVVVGSTGSVDFPLHSSLQDQLKGTMDAFITVINKTGTAFQLSSYFGGLGLDKFSHVQVVNGHDLILAGVSSSVDFPLLKPGKLNDSFTGFADTVITKITSGLDVDWWSTFLGCGEPVELAGLGLDNQGNIYLGGTIHAGKGVTKNGLSLPSVNEKTGYIAKVSQNGDSLIYGTYLGGTKIDELHSLKVFPTGEVFAVGGSYSSDFPLVDPIVSSNLSPGKNSGTVALLGKKGNNLLFSSYLGGDSTDCVYSCGINKDNYDLFALGLTQSSNFPLKTPIVQGKPLNAGFLSKITGVLYKNPEISGYVKDNNGKGIANVLISVSKGVRGYTNNKGYYRIHVQKDQSITLVASKPCYSFTPKRVSLNDIYKPQTVNFTAYNYAKATGTLKIGSMPIRGARIYFSNGGGFAVTDSKGRFSHGLPCGWTGKIVVKAFNYAITARPSSLRKVTSRKTIRFTAKRMRQVMITGRVTEKGKPVSRVRLTFNPGNRRSYTNSQGYFKRFVPYNWYGKVVLNKTCMSFSPANKSIPRVRRTYRANFRGISRSFVSGKITFNGRPLNRVKVSFSGRGGFTYTNVRGYYKKPLKCGWKGRVTPYRKGFRFTPRYKWIPRITGPVRSNFTAGKYKVRVNGVLQYRKKRLKNAKIYFTNRGGSTLTNNNGYFSHYLTSGWSGRIVVRANGYRVVPKPSVIKAIHRSQKIRFAVTRKR